MKAVPQYFLGICAQGVSGHPFGTEVDPGFQNCGRIPRESIRLEDFSQG